MAGSSYIHKALVLSHNCLPFYSGIAQAVYTFRAKEALAAHSATTYNTIVEMKTRSPGVPDCRWKMLWTTSLYQAIFWRAILSSCARTARVLVPKFADDISKVELATYCVGSRAWGR